MTHETWLSVKTLEHAGVHIKNNDTLEQWFGSPRFLPFPSDNLTIKHILYGTLL